MQPALTTDGDVLIGSGIGADAGMGVRRIAVAHGPNGVGRPRAMDLGRAKTLLQ